MNRYLPAAATLVLLAVLIGPVYRQAFHREVPGPGLVAVGLPEAERQRIFRELVGIGDQARAEADRQYSITGKSVTPDQLRKNAKAAQALRFSARLKLAERCNLTRKQLAAIEVEGMERRWQVRSGNHTGR